MAVSNTPSMLHWYLFPSITSVVWLHVPAKVANNGINTPVRNCLFKCILLVCWAELYFTAYHWNALLLCTTLANFRLAQLIMTTDHTFLSLTDPSDIRNIRIQCHLLARLTPYWSNTMCQDVCSYSISHYANYQTMTLIQKCCWVGVAS